MINQPIENILESKGCHHRFDNLKRDKLLERLEELLDLHME